MGDLPVYRGEIVEHQRAVKMVLKALELYGQKILMED